MLLILEQGFSFFDNEEQVTCFLSEKFVVKKLKTRKTNGGKRPKNPSTLG